MSQTKASFFFFATCILLPTFSTRFLIDTSESSSSVVTPSKSIVLCSRSWRTTCFVVCDRRLAVSDVALLNCNTTTVTVLTATAATTLSHRVCVFLVSMAGIFHNLLQAARHGHALSHLSRHISQSHPPRAGSTAVFVRGMACHKKRTPSVQGICWERVKMMIQVALPHALSQDHRWQGHTPGSGRVHGWASGFASSWVSTNTGLTANKTDHRENFTHKPDHQKNLTVKLYRSIVKNKHEHQKNLTLKLYRSIMTKRTSTRQSGPQKIEPMTLMR